jgi:hypothetical protein
MSTEHGSGEMKDFIPGKHNKWSGKEAENHESRSFILQWKKTFP